LHVIALLRALHSFPTRRSSDLQDLTVAHYNAYKKIDQIINMVGVDPRFDLGLPSEPLSSVTWLGNIVMDQPNHLYNYSNIAHQTDRKSTRLNSSHVKISYAVFC